MFAKCLNCPLFFQSGTLLSAYSVLCKADHFFQIPYWHLKKNNLYFTNIPLNKKSVCSTSASSDEQPHSAPRYYGNIT